MKKWTLKTTLGDISYYIQESLEKKWIIIFCHWLGWEKLWKKTLEIWKHLISIWYSYISFDFFWHWESSWLFENITPEQSESSLNSIYNLVKKLWYKKIGICWNSYGCAIAMSLATKKNISFLILRSPVSNYQEKEIKKYWTWWINKWQTKGYCIKNLWKGEQKLGYNFLLWMNKYLWQELWKNILCPTLIIHWSLDEQIPVQQSIDLNKLLKNGRLIIINWADHRFSIHKYFIESVNFIIDFIKYTNNE